MSGWEQTQFMLQTFSTLVSTIKKLKINSSHNFPPDSVSEIKKHICRATNCSVTVLNDCTSERDKHWLQLFIRPPQKLTTNASAEDKQQHMDDPLLSITFLSCLLSFIPMKQSFQLASKLCAALGWGPSKPPVCRQVSAQRKRLVL